MILAVQFLVKPTYINLSLYIYISLFVHVDLFGKMQRKDVGIRQVYDARALRVIVGDKEGSLHGPAVRGCYSVLDIIHRYILLICMSYSLFFSF
jgi:hypothetical protein